MGKKGKTGRLKRNPAPRIWPIHRKERVWTVKPSSGPHSLEQCLPLSLVIRDILGLAATRKEAQKIISASKVYVDGKVRRKDDFPVGLMDVLSIPDLNKFFRVIPFHKGLFLNPISKEEAAFKMCRVEDRATVKDGNMQIALHDGSNLFVNTTDPENQEVKYETFDVLKLSLPEKQVLYQIKTKKGNVAVITGGKNIGKQGRIVEIEKTTAKKRRQALVVVEDEQGVRYQTILDFVFSLGSAQTVKAQPEATATV